MSMMQMLLNTPKITGYRYFRLWVDSPFSGSVVEGQFRVFVGGSVGTKYPANMTSNTLPVPLVASASSATSGAAYFAFDVLTNNHWQTSGTSGWVQVDLGSGVSINPDFMQLTGNGNNGPKVWRMAGDIDGSGGAFTGGGTILKSVTETVQWGLFETRNYNIP